MGFGEQFYHLEYMKTYCYNLFQKYDSMINKENNKSLIMLGHCIVMMCDTTKLLKRCFEEQNYSIFVSYKDIEIFLNMAKDQIDLNSYFNYKKRMVMYAWYYLILYTLVHYHHYHHYHYHHETML